MGADQPFPLTDTPIVCIASAAWDSMWVNAQHLMSRLARHNRVLYINNPGLRPPGGSRSDLAKILARLRQWFLPPIEKSPGCFVVTPIFIPLLKYPWIRRFNDFMLLRLIKKHTRRLGMERPILWTFLPMVEKIAGRAGESALVYHCVDDYAKNPNVPADFIRESEKRLLKAALVTFVTNPKLLEDKKANARRIRYFPNTADVPRFRDYKGAPPELLADLKKQGGRIIGFQGNISAYKTDLQLLAKIAEAFPEDHLVLVGPIGWGDPSTDLGMLSALPNVHFTGRVDFDDLPGYVHGFDVCLIPAKINESNMSSFPMKFFEYLACEKPVVANRLPAFEQWANRPEIVGVANGHDEFIDHVRRALTEPGDQAVRNARFALALENDWEERARQIADEVRIALKEGSV